MDKKNYGRERREDGYNKTNRYSRDGGEQRQGESRERRDGDNRGTGERRFINRDRQDGGRSFNRDNGEQRGYSRDSGDRRERNFNRPSQGSDNGGREHNFNRERRDGDNRGTGERRFINRDRQDGGRSFNRDNGEQRGYSRDSGDRRDRNFNRPSQGSDNGGREHNFNRERRDGDNRGTGERRFVNRDRQDGGRSFNRDNGEQRGYSRDNGDRRDRNFNRPSQGNDNGGREHNFNRERRNDGGNRENGERNFYRNRDEAGERRDNGNRFERNDGRFNRSRSYESNNIDEAGKEELRQKHYSKKKQLEHRIKNEKEDSELRLNRYISMGGVCSRRDADALITEGRVKVNGEVVQSVGVKVNRKDQVEVDGNLVTPERKVYLVLNKPKDFVTTVEDPLERKTVMSLIENACKERVYPVGRLDRMTTGVLLFTNDGDLAKKLTHPKYNHKKIYHVFLDKAVSEVDMKSILTGIELEDGFINADDVRYASDNQSEIGIEIHSGKNRIVRRIFEHFGYQIVKLDRVYFAGITKKNLPRGKWRLLNPQEVEMLKCY